MKHSSKRVLSFVLCLCLLMSMIPTMIIDTAAASTKTIYFDNSGKNWSTVYVYTWNSNGDCTGSWPGKTMTKVSGSIYSYEVPTAATSIIFNNGNGAQTCDLGVPTRMCLFKGENHELSRSGKPHNRISRLTEIGDWFEKYLKQQ